ncbi:aminopeptidase RNPEPL1 [Rhinatrema bivittatum]|uniref:aminopeptidase RNPEPL1 n=1 Tax=Rhinatrema bivittatum TaxID=194408 RepID=UPI001129598C|nr:aminopeptidase RNPEPL1 [Rhinatrema bivittatum]
MASASPPLAADLASASSFQHYRLHHFHLGLELRPEARELAGCLVLELSALRPEPCALVLDTHPALSVQSVCCRLGPPSPQDTPAPRSPAAPACPQDTPAPSSPASCPQDTLAPCSPAPSCPQDTSAPPGFLGHPASSVPQDTPFPSPGCSGSPPSPDPCRPLDSPSCCGLSRSLETPASLSPPVHHNPLDIPAPCGPLDSPVFCGLSESPAPCSPLCSPSPISLPLPHDTLDIPDPWSPPCTPEPCGMSVPCASVRPPIFASCSPLGSTYHFINGTTQSDHSSNTVTLSAPSISSSLLSAPSPPSPSLSSIPISASSVACNPVIDPFLTRVPCAGITSHPSDPVISDPSCDFQPIPVTSLATDPLPTRFCLPADMHNCTVPNSAGSRSYSCLSCPLVFRVDAFTDYGSALILSVPDELQPHQPFQVTIRYTTTVGPAVWWLDPELTYGNSKLFVFTQGHSVCNRSFFPCFDTPAVKCTYSATVKAPAGIQVLMSATRSSYLEEEGVYQFYMEYPVPAYLVALVAGDIIPADIGPRSRVWAEPCLLSTATSKLGGLVERWLCAAESLYGPYIWGRYDLVFLPPSFPIVAMENPCLTFIISSILDSDEFLIIDVIHEIAHSWFGNAVTNATWEEMWLSEGLATYAQRRITAETYGAAFTCLETAFRLDALHRQMKLLGHDTPVSKLQVKLELGVNPSNLMNLFTYEKGYCFVYYLSQLCGDLKRFDSFLRAYIEKYMFCSVVAQDLLDSFLNFFPELQEKCVESREGLEFERWLNATGPPLAEPDLSQGSSFTNPVETLCELWTADPLDASIAAANIDITTWRTFQTVLFLDRLLDRSPLPHEVMVRLSKSYSSLLDSMNAEIRIRWLQLVVRNNYYPDLYRVRRFLESQMSRMYTIPLYEDLCASSLNPFALEVFYQTQNQLHPNLRKTIQQILLQGVNSALSSTDPAVVTLTAPAEPTQGAISLRNVNVSA